MQHCMHQSLYNSIASFLEQESEWVGSILHLEQPEQEGEDENEDYEPEVDAGSLFRSGRLRGYEYRQGDDAERKQSVYSSVHSFWIKFTRRQPLTSHTNNLTFNTQLILITTSNPTNMPTLTNPDIRSIFDPIPHESRSKRQNQDKGENTPNDPTLNKR